MVESWKLPLIEKYPDAVYEVAQSIYAQTASGCLTTRTVDLL